MSNIMRVVSRGAAGTSWRRLNRGQRPYSEGTDTVRLSSRRTTSKPFVKVMTSGFMAQRIRLL